MRSADILRFAFGALFQQKVRTFLTTLGVILGTFVLVASVSIGRGVRDKVMSLFQRNDQLRRIEVFVDYSTVEDSDAETEPKGSSGMSEARRERLRLAIARHRNSTRSILPKATLNAESLHNLTGLDHVVRLVPEVNLPGRVTLNDKSEAITIYALPIDSPQLLQRLIAGDGFQSGHDQSVVLHEFLLYRWGIIDDADLAAVIGKRIRLDVHYYGMRRPNLLLSLLGGTDAAATVNQEAVLEKAAKQIPAALEKMDFSPAERTALKQLLSAPRQTPAIRPDHTLSAEFTIAGVVRCTEKGDTQQGSFGRDQQALYSEVILPPDTARDLVLQLPDLKERGFNRVTVVVDDEENVEVVAASIKELGFQYFALVEIAQRVKLNLLLISLATGFVAGVALVVAALGITNTMLMTVLERMHEIGVMKAVGARDIHIQLIFLVEGSLIGLVGGLLGLLAGWLSSFPLNAVARSIVEKQTHQPLEESLFVFPPLMMASIVGFAALVTTLAAVYPARRAAKVNPVTALRHE